MRGFDDRKISGDRLVALQKRRVTIIVDKVPRTLDEMLRNKSKDPADCLVTEMLQRLQTKNVHEVHWFDKRFERECRATESKILHRAFLKKPDAKFGKALRGFRAVALLKRVYFQMQTILCKMASTKKTTTT